MQGPLWKIYPLSVAVVAIVAISATQPMGQASFASAGTLPSTVGNVATFLAIVLQIGAFHGQRNGPSRTRKDA